MDITYVLAVIVAIVVIVMLTRLANKNSSKESFTGNVDHDGHTEAPPVHNTSNIAPGNAEEAVRALLNTGNKIEAIKRVREQKNLGLKEAKDYVEQLR